MEPIRGSDALDKLSTIADKFLGGSRRVDAVRLIEESLEGKTGLH